jgi:hypothetical protein
VRRKCKRYYKIIVISPTLIQNSEYDYFLSKFVFFDYQQEIIQNIVVVQKENLHLYCLVILDDIIGVL